MDDRNKFDLADAAATVVVAGVIAFVVFTLKGSVTVVARTLMKYGRHPAVLMILGAWLISLLFVGAVASVPDMGAMALLLAVVASFVAIGALAITEIVLDQRRALTSMVDDPLLAELDTWWGEESDDESAADRDQPSAAHRRR